MLRAYGMDVREGGMRRAPCIGDGCERGGMRWRLPDPWKRRDGGEKLSELSIHHNAHHQLILS